MQYFGFARINTYNNGRGSLRYYARGHKSAIKPTHTHTHILISKHYGPGQTLQPVKADHIKPLQFSLIFKKRGVT